MKKSKYGSIDNSIENTNAEEIISQTYCRCSYIIEPVIFLLNFAMSIQGIAFGQFIYIRILNRLIENESIALTDLTNSTIINRYSFNNFTTFPTTTSIFPTTTLPTPSTNDDRLCNSNSSFANSSTDIPSDFDQLRVKAQKESAHFLFILALIGGIPCIFTTNLIGINSTKLGRKLIILMIVTVMTIRACIYFALSINPKLPDYLFYICAAMDGLSGSSGLLYLVSHCYIADLTTEKSRSYRITLINYIGLITSLLISYACGYVIKYLGYVYIFSSALFFYILALIYLIIFVPEPIKEVRSKCIIERIKSCSVVRVKKSFQVLLRKNHPIYRNGELESNEETSQLLNETEDQAAKLGERQHTVIVLVIVANLIYCAAGAGMGSIFTLFIMNKPFCWDSVNISTYLLYSTVVAILCSLFVSKFIKINDIIICIMSVLSHISATLSYAFAKNSLGIYIGTSVGSLGGLEYGYVRSLVSKLITKHEVTDAITLIAWVDTITGVIGQTVFPLIYEKIVDTQLKTVFYILVGIFTVTLLLHMIALALYKKPTIIPTVKCEDEEGNEDSSIGIASIENGEPFIPTCSASNQADSISQLYNSLVIASHEKDNKSTASA